ncbi:MAG: GNAT family N-acetyltransferase [Paracoccus denitrificans]|uniref:GNAT family N-acetyltransferase n=1 Tax=Paracoccus denitrificans TaxID=266 RepID=A0A533IEY1_PARDE|nr:MAG: GNAT family N-acetyltransferase [Paracoccus denitrificans]
MDIRALRSSDKDQWQALWHGYQTFYGHADRPQAFFDTAFARLLSDDPVDFQGLVADDGGRLLGLTHFVFHPHLWRPEGVCYLQDLFTLPDTRGKGVGRALIEAVAQAAEARGVGAVYWLTSEDNYAGRMLYDRVASRTSFIKYQRDIS